MTPAQLKDLLDKFSRGECTPEEEHALEIWYDQLGESGEPLSEGEKKRTEARIWTAINPAPVATPKIFSWRRLLRAAAIALPIVGVSLFIYLQNRSEQPAFAYVDGIIPEEGEADRVYTNNTIKPMKVKLEDGSVVVLQPSSQLEVAKQFGLKQREVRLEGEGFFEVRPDASRPFVVYANEIVTRVLGTSFRIRAYEDDKEVTVAVKTGKVSVSASRMRTSRQALPSDEVILTPNQQMVYHRVREVISRTLVEEPIVVKPNESGFRMQFDNAPVSEILDDLARNYGIVIRYEEEVLENCRLTTTMSEEGLYERIEVICKAIGASYMIDEDAAITIESNGC